MLRDFTNPDDRDDFVLWFNETHPEELSDLWSRWMAEIEEVEDSESPFHDVW